MLAMGGAFGISYFLGLFPAVKEYVPSYLLESASLLAGVKAIGDYLPAVLITVALLALQGFVSIIAFSKKNI